MGKYDKWQDYEDELMEDSFRQNTKVRFKTKKKQKEQKNESKRKFEYRKKDNIKR
tara:strand:- start:1393 stop:1557 length:165 start_codon:yes stop_codon:yes gene_type:complete